MSRVYFHTPSGDTEILGSERAYAGGLVGDLTVGIVKPRFLRELDVFRQLIPASHYLWSSVDNMPRFESSFETAWKVQLELAWKGHTFDCWTVSLNTVQRIGNDPLKFLARMHAQCEIHAFVEGANRAWLAEIIHKGRVLGLYREGAGWEDVVKLLLTRDDEPAVMSYSVCERFPNASSSDWLPPWPEGVPLHWDALTKEQQDERERLSEEWYDLPDEEQWERGLNWLRKEPGMLEFKPETWEGYGYSHGISAFDLVAPDYAERLDRALSVVP